MQWPQPAKRIPQQDTVRRSCIQMLAALLFHCCCTAVLASTPNGEAGAAQSSAEQSSVAQSSLAESSAAPTVAAQQAWLDLQQLAGDDMAGRANGSAGSALAQQYLSQRYRQLGLDEFYPGYRQPFQFRRGFSERTGVNLVGLRRGCRHPEQYIVVTAHYDHLPVSGGKIYNGADDNASGVAGLLYLASQTALHCPAYSYWFVATDAEELGLDGATAFWQQAPQANILLNINLDMISRGERRNTLFLAGKRQLPELVQFADRYNVSGQNPSGQHSPVRLVLAHDQRQSRLGRSGVQAVDWANASDHAVFRRAGLPYLYFGVDVHPHYHTPDDDWQRIDPQFFQAVLALIEQSRQFVDALPPERLQAAQKPKSN